MILQVLTDYYEVMAARGLAALEGWCRAKVKATPHKDEAVEKFTKKW